MYIYIYIYIEAVCPENMYIYIYMNTDRRPHLVPGPTLFPPGHTLSPGAPFVRAHLVPGRITYPGPPRSRNLPCS